MSLLRTSIYSYAIAITGFLAGVPSAEASGGHLPPYWGPIVACGSSTRPCDWCELIHTGVHVVALMTTVVIFVIVPVGMAVGSIMMIVAGFSESLALFTQGKKAFFAAVVSGCWVLAAFVVLGAVFVAIGNGTGQIQISWGTIVCP